MNNKISFKFPENNELDIKSLKNIFNSTTKSYKYFLFYYIFSYAERKDTNINVNMKDLLKNIVSKFYKFFDNYSIKLEENNLIYQGFKIMQKKDTLVNINNDFKLLNKKFIKYVPYRLLSCFYEDSLKRVPDYKKNDLIEKLSKKDKKAFYHIEQTNIKINNKWLDWFRQNYILFKKWFIYNFFSFLKKYNSYNELYPVFVDYFEMRKIGKVVCKIEYTKSFNPNRVSKINNVLFETQKVDAYLVNYNKSYYNLDVFRNKRNRKYLKEKDKNKPLYLVKCDSSLNKIVTEKKLDLIRKTNLMEYFFSNYKNKKMQQKQCKTNINDFFTNNLSCRAFNILKNNNLLEKKKLRNFYYNFNFKDLKNCGTKTKKELKKFVENYILNRNSLIKNYNIYKFVKLNDFKNNLDKQIIKFLDSAEIKSLYDLIEFYNNNKDLSNLVQHSKVYKLKLKNFMKTINYNYYKDLIKKKYSLIELDNCRVFLSKRIISRLMKKGYDNFYDLIKHYSYNGTFKNIQGIGTKSNSKLMTLIEIFKISTNYKRALFVKFCKDKLNKSYSKFIDFKSKDLKVFKLFNHFFDKTDNFDDIGKDLINYYMEIYKSQNENLTYKQIADKHLISKQRVRQKKVNIEKVISNINKYLQFYSNYINYFNEYEEDNYIYIDKKIFNRINIRAKGTFTKSFIFEVLGELYQNKYSKISNDVYFLIKNNIFNKFDFVSFMKNFKEKLERNRTKRTKYPLKGIVYNYLKGKYNDELYENILEIIEELIFQQFNLISKNNYIILPSNKRITKIKKVENVLFELGKIVSLKELYTELQKKGIKYKNKESLRNDLFKTRKVIPIGAKSQYVHKKIKNKLGIIKGFSNDLAEKYLDKFNKPKHKSEICAFILEKRNYKKTSVYIMMKMDPKDRFQFFPLGFIGLKHKNYQIDDNFKKINQSEILKRINEYNAYFLYDKVVKLLSSDFNISEELVEMYFSILEKKDVIKNNNGKIIIKNVNSIRRQL